MLSVQLGPLAIPAGLAAIYLGVFCALIIGWWVGRKRDTNPESALLNILLVGFVAARIGFVVRYADAYGTSLIAMLDIRDGGFLPLVGILAGFATAVLYLWRKPRLRTPLGSALASGVLISGLGLAMLNALHQSQQLPELSFRDIHGQPVQLQDYLGQPVVINLWATWCPPCRREMPVLQAAQEKTPDVTFVFINQGESTLHVQHFLAAQELSLDNLLLDSNAHMGQAVSSLSLPTTLFYDAEGRLRNNHLGELSKASLNHALQSIYKESP